MKNQTGLHRRLGLWTIILSLLGVCGLANATPLGFENAALGKSVVSSGEYGPEYAKENAVDGDLNTAWGADPSVEKPFLYVDLNEVMPVNGIGVDWTEQHFGKECGVFTSLDEENWTKAIQISNTSGEPNSLIWYTPVDSRYVGVICTEKNTGTIGIDELEVYTAKSTPDEGEIVNLQTGQWFTSAQDALDAAQNGAELLFGPGVFWGVRNTPSDTVPIFLSDKEDLILSAVNPHTDENQTSLMGLKIENSSNIVVENFKLSIPQGQTNNLSMVIEDSSDVTIANNYVAATAEGILLLNADGTVFVRNIFKSLATALVGYGQNTKIYHNKFGLSVLYTETIDLGGSVEIKNNIIPMYAEPRAAVVNVDLEPGNPAISSNVFVEDLEEPLFTPVAGWSIEDVQLNNTFVQSLEMGPNNMPLLDSVLIDAGELIPGINHEVSDNLPDVGPGEYFKYAAMWTVGKSYTVGQMVYSLDDNHYACRQAHTAYDVSWTPESQPALWEVVYPE